jgi:hypothetical protein
MWLSGPWGREPLIRPFQADSGNISGFRVGYFFLLAGTAGCLVAPVATSFSQAA